MFPRPHQPPPEAPLLSTLADGTKVKRRMLRMRACNELNAKGKMCMGHLKRWYGPTEELRNFEGWDDVYRCERCHTLYLKNLDEVPRTGTVSW